MISGPALLETLPEPVVLVSEHGAIDACNSAFARLFGTTPPALAGQNLADITAEPAEPLRQYVASCCRTSSLLPGRLLLKDGTQWRLDGRALALTGDSSKPLALMRLRPRQEAIHRFLLLKDKVAELETELGRRQKAEDELRALNATLDERVKERTTALEQALSQMEEFSYTVSHDLRAPLRAIAGYAQILVDGYAHSLDDDARRYLDRISRSAVQMNRLIGDVLRLSRITSGIVQLKSVPLPSILQSVIQDNPSMQAPRADISIQALDQVLADEVLLSQAITNLLSNAVKFVAPGTKPVVRVWSEANAGLVRLCVEDNGIGIPPELRGKLFGVFQRLSTDPAYDGTGIGLSIVRRAVERMGGRVGLESSQHAGSRFWIELRSA